MVLQTKQEIEPLAYGCQNLWKKRKIEYCLNDLEGGLQILYNGKKPREEKYMCTRRYNSVLFYTVNSAVCMSAACIAACVLYAHILVVVYRVSVC